MAYENANNHGVMAYENALVPNNQDVKPLPNFGTQTDPYMIKSLLICPICQGLFPYHNLMTNHLVNFHKLPVEYIDRMNLRNEIKILDLSEFNKKIQ